jgi:hypothetical protein
VCVCEKVLLASIAAWQVSVFLVSKNFFKAILKIFLNQDIQSSFFS